MTALEDFLLWVNGLIEDDPLPYEVEYVYFCLHRDGFYFYLSMGGSENPLKHVLNFEYYPLEAQFFDIKKYMADFILFDLKKLVENALKNIEFRNNFKNKKLFVGIFGEKESFLLEND